MTEYKKYIKSFLLWELIKGLLITFNHLFSKKITVQFPEERIPISLKFRGLHALRRHPDGEDRCISCKLCEIICPAIAIGISSDNDRKDGTRRTKKYEIDLFKCIYCGSCEEACPVDSIIETIILDYHFSDSNERCMTKDKLLLVGDKYEKLIDVQKKY